MNSFIAFVIRTDFVLPVSVAFLFLTTSCVEQELSIELPELQEQSLAVLAVLDNGRPPSVLLSGVEPLDDEAVMYPVDQANVVLFEDAVPLDTLSLLVNTVRPTDPLQNSVYYSDSLLNFREGSSYYLRVAAAGYRTAESESLTFHRAIDPDVKVSTEITDTTGGRAIGTVNLVFEVVLDRNGGEYVIQTLQEAKPENFATNMWTPEQVAAEVSLSRVNLYPFLLSQSRRFFAGNFPAGTYRGSYESAIDFPESQLITSVTHYSSHFLAFAEGFSKQDREEIGGLGTQLQPLPSNIKGGYGYFTIRDSQSIPLN